MARLGVAISAACLMLAGQAFAEDTSISKIDDATYGVEEEIAKRNNCGNGTLDVTSKLAALCNGKSSCRIPVHNQSMGSDPCKGAGKVLDIVYTCSDGTSHSATCNEANEMLILCPSIQAPEGGFDCAYDAALEPGK